LSLENRLRFDHGWQLRNFFFSPPVSLPLTPIVVLGHLIFKFEFSPRPILRRFNVFFSTPDLFHFSCLWVGLLFFILSDLLDDHFGSLRSSPFPAFERVGSPQKVCFLAIHLFLALAGFFFTGSLIERYVWRHPYFQRQLSFVCLAFSVLGLGSGTLAQVFWGPLLAPLFFSFFHVFVFFFFLRCFFGPRPFTSRLPVPILQRPVFFFLTWVGWSNLPVVPILVPLFILGLVSWRPLLRSFRFAVCFLVIRSPSVLFDNFFFFRSTPSF